MSMLELRRSLKSKKPHFHRQDSKKRKEVALSWRRPKGIQSKMRLKKKGHPKPVEIGYRSPKEVRGMHRKGLFPRLVMNREDVEKLDSKKDGIIIGKGVGLKKRIEIIEAAAKNGIMLLNVHAEKIMQKKEERKREKQKEEITVKKEMAKKEKGEEKQEMSEEEKKKAYKEEKDKVLIKRDL